MLGSIVILPPDATDDDLAAFVAALSDRHVTVGGKHGPGKPQKSHGRAGYLDVDNTEVVEAAGRLHAAATASSPAITADMHVIAGATGGEFEGLQNSVKSEASLRRKLATDTAYASKKLPVGEREGKIKDANRYTQVLSDENYSAGIERGRLKAEELGYHVETKNPWRDQAAGYAGYHMTLRKKGFLPVELQFHTPRSYGAKERGDAKHPPSHVLYKALRVTRYKPKKARLQSEINALWAPVRAAMPPGATGLRGAGVRPSG